MTLKSLNEEITWDFWGSGFIFSEGEMVRSGVKIWHSEAELDRIDG